MATYTCVRDLEVVQREAATATATRVAHSQLDAESSDDSDVSETGEQPPGILVQAYLRGSAASKSGLKPEVVPADEPLSDRVVVPPEGSALPEAGVYISNGKRVSVLCYILDSCVFAQLIMNHLLSFCFYFHWRLGALHFAVAASS